MQLCRIVVLIFAATSPAFAQAPAIEAAQPRLIISERALAGGLDRMPPAVQSRDSVRNGAIIGAVIGAVALAAPGAWICHMLKEPGDPPCLKGVLTLGAVGAGVGAAAGAGVDALFVRDQRPRLSGSR
ncbi:MAG TPA: hypothetical protein VFZ31_01475 [Vicinamibacterales bacterium]